MSVMQVLVVMGVECTIENKVNMMLRVTIP